MNDQNVGVASLDSVTLREALAESVNQLRTIQMDHRDRWSNERTNRVSATLLMADRALAAPPPLAPVPDQTGSDLVKREILHGLQLQPDSEMGRWLKGKLGELSVAVHGAPQASSRDGNEVASTPAATWRVAGEPDPHAGQYDVERAALCLGNLTDDELANGAFLNHDMPLNLQGILDGTHYSPIAWMTGVKDRIRWLSRALESARSGAKSTQVHRAWELLKAERTDEALAALSKLVGAEPAPISRAQWIVAAKAFYLEAGDDEATAAECARWLCNEQDWLSGEIGDPCEEAQEDVRGRGRSVPGAPARAEPVAAESELRILLDEVRQHFTRDDDLPGDLLQRIDSALNTVELSLSPRSEGGEAAQEQVGAGTVALRKGYVAVPMRLTRAMQDVLEEEGWQWADLLMMAEATTEDEDEAIRRFESLDLLEKAEREAAERQSHAAPTAREQELKTTPKFDKGWSLVQAVCRCALLGSPEAIRHQVQRLADFYGEDRAGRMLSDMLRNSLAERPEHSPRLVPSTVKGPHEEAKDAIQWPQARDVGRLGDMSPSASMRVGFDGDNDVSVSVWDEHGGGCVEFCVPGSGGGKSPRTRRALIALMVAMEGDNAEDPGRDWWARRAQKGATFSASNGEGREA